MVIQGDERSDTFRAWQHRHPQRHLHAPSCSTALNAFMYPCSRGDVPVMLCDNATLIICGLEYSAEHQPGELDMAEREPLASR